MSDLSCVKIGDKLFIKGGPYDKGHIVTVDRITPSGRVVTKSGEFNKNGKKRGDQGWTRTFARLATEDDIAGIYRHRLVLKISNFRLWHNLSIEDLKTASELITKYDNDTNS